MNSVNIIGNITRDIEVRFLQSGAAVADASIAVNDRVKRGADWVDEVSYFDLTLFGKTAEVACEYARKGTKVAIEGRLKQDRWQDKDSGANRSKVKIVVDRLHLLGSKPAEERKQPEAMSLKEFGEDIPF
jgi:single-strand DNA-binding protein